MKNLFALFSTLVLVTLIISCTKNSFDDVKPINNTALLETIARASGESCIRTNFPGSSCFDGTYTYSLSLPSYPGCTFEISVDYVNCVGDGGTRSIHLGDFIINDHDCPQYNIDLANANTQNSLHVFQTSFNQKVWAALTDNLLNNTPPLVNTVLALEYIVSQCTRTCYVNIPPSKGNPFSAIVPVKINCGTNCCRLIDRYAVSNGNWDLEETITEAVNTECKFEGLPFCIRDTVFSSDCDDNCESLNFN